MSGAGGDHEMQSGSRIDYHFTFAGSSEDTPRDWEIEWEQGGINFRPDISDPDNIRANPAAGISI